MYLIRTSEMGHSPYLYTRNQNIAEILTATVACYHSSILNGRRDYIITGFILNHAPQVP